MGRIKDLPDLSRDLVSTDFFIMDNESASYKINPLKISDAVFSEKESTIRSIAESIATSIATNTAQENKFMQLDTATTEGTDDYNLYTAITALEWESEVIENA